MSSRRWNPSLLVIPLWLLLGVACTTPREDISQSGEGVINPGDTVGDFLVRTAEPGEYIHLWECGGNELYYCKADSDAIVNISVGLFAEPGEDLDQIWAEHTYEMAIDGRPVNLLAFGSVDAVHPHVGAMRAWNVVLVPSGPSAVETTHSVVAGGDLLEVEIPCIFGDSARGRVLEEAALSPMQADDALPVLSPAARTGQRAYYSEEAGLDYLLFVPGDFVANAEQEWPLIINLHGAIPRSNIEMLKESGLPEVLEDKGELPSFVVSPRVLGAHEFWGEERNIDALTALLAEIEMKLPIDSGRIYLTGESAGGYGTWEIGLRYPDRFAAIAPVAGYYGWPFSVPEDICDLKDVPVWAFHGAKDELLPLAVAQQIVDALEDCGGNVQFTILPEGGHEIAEEVYAGQELFEWLLSQRN